MGSIFVKLGLNSDQFERGLDRARGSVRKFGRVAESGMNLPRLLGVSAAVAGLERVTAHVERLQDAARRLGVGVGFTQELQGLADKMAGVEVEDLVEFLQDLNEKAIDAAKGSKEAAEGFEMLGLSAEGMLKMSHRDRLLAIMDALHGTADAGERSAAMMKMGSDEATKLIPELARGSAAFLEMAGSMQKFSEAAAADLAEARKGVRGFWTNFLNWGTKALHAAGLQLKGFHRAIRQMLSPGGMRDMRFTGPLDAYLSVFEESLEKQRELLNAAHDAEIEMGEMTAEEILRIRTEAAEKAAEKEKQEKAKMWKEQEAMLKRHLEAEKRERERAEREHADKVRDFRRQEADDLREFQDAYRLEERDLEQMLGRLSRNSGGPELDSLTAVGLGLSGVNYNLAQPKGEQLQFKILKELEEIRDAIEAFDREIEIRADEFGG